MMKAWEVAEKLPKALREYASIFIRSEEYNDPFAPPSTIQDVVWLSETHRSKHISDESLSWIAEWLESREDAEESAKALLEQIHVKHPLPTNEQVVAGASIPEYTIAPWYKILYQPWSRLFEEAIEQGWKWLKNN
jgi:hypothetical protein